MSDGNTIPVIAGLAIGVAFVVVFSLVIMPVAALTDEEIIENTKGLKEVQFFLEMHPDTEIRVERNDAPSGIDVYYSIEKQIYEPTGFDSGIRTKELIIRVDSSGEPAGIMLACGAGRTAVMFHVTTDMIANECFVEPRNSSVAISFATYLGMGDCFNNCPHTHRIFIFDNGTGIHQEKHDGKRVYYIFQAPTQPIIDLIDQVNSIERQPPVHETAEPDTIMIDLYCRSGYVDASISLVMNGEREKTLCYPGVPEVMDLQEKMERIQSEYDDGIIDCIPESAYPVADCPVYLPEDAIRRTEGDPSPIKPETGMFEPETEVGEPIPIEVSADNTATIEITYEED